MAASDAVAKHDEVALQQAAHRQAHTSWTKIANYKGKPGAQAKAKKLVDT